MKNYLLPLIPILLIGSTGLAKTQSIEEQYIAKYASRTDVPVPVRVVSPPLKTLEKGEVTLLFRVSPQGEVHDVVIRDSVGNVNPGKVAQAVRSWKFQPKPGQTQDVPLQLVIALSD